MQPKVALPPDLEDNSILMPGMSMEALTALAIAEQLEVAMPSGSSLQEPTSQLPPIPTEFLSDFVQA